GLPRNSLSAGRRTKGGEKKFVRLADKKQFRTRRTKKGAKKNKREPEPHHEKSRKTGTACNNLSAGRLTNKDENFVRLADKNSPATRREKERKKQTRAGAAPQKIL